MENELTMQANVFKWFWNEFPEQRRMLFHINNNSVSTIAGARAKALGVVKGISDFIFVGNSFVCFIELKLINGTQSIEQIDFMQKVISRGHKYFITRSEEQFKKLIWELISIGK